MHIYLVRHGKTVSSGTYCGAGDVPLADEGRLQVLNIAPFLKKTGVSHCFSSPLLRCRETLKLLDLDVNCSVEENLREIHFGRWEGMTFDEISRNDPEKLEEWMKLQEQFTFPGGEKILDFSSRIGECFKMITSTNFEKVLVVCHGGVIRHALCHLLELPCHKANSFEIGEGTVSSLIYENGHSVLQKLNYNG